MVHIELCGRLVCGKRHLLTGDTGCVILEQHWIEQARSLGEAALTRYDDRQGLGRRGEQLAAENLEAKGFQIVARNWRCETGELDLVARDGECLVMVEVRTRRGQSMGSPEASITAAKQERLALLGLAYVQENKWAGDWRIDVVAIEMDRRGRVLRMAHYENAVTG